MAMITNRRREMHAVISRNMFSFPLPPCSPFFCSFFAAHIVLVFGVRSVESEEITSLKNELSRRQSVCLPRLLLAFPSIDEINFSFQHLYLESSMLWRRKIQLNFPCKTECVVSLVPLAIPLWQHFAIIDGRIQFNKYLIYRQ